MQFLEITKQQHLRVFVVGVPLFIKLILAPWNGHRIDGRMDPHLNDKDAQ